MDSALEEAVTSELVSEDGNSLLVGKFREFHHSELPRVVKPQQKGQEFRDLWGNSLRFLTGNFFGLAGY
jgi:hypothetical protein